MPAYWHRPYFIDFKGLRIISPLMVISSLILVFVKYFHPNSTEKQVTDIMTTGETFMVMKKFDESGQRKLMVVWKDTESQEAYLQITYLIKILI